MKESLLLIVVSAFVTASCRTPPPSLSRGEEHVKVQVGEVVLSGTLELPEAQGEIPAVLLVPGSAAFDRSNFGLFDTVAHRLAQVGVASLRMDDRGAGESQGTKHDLSVEDLSRDVMALHTYLSSREEIDSDRVGLLGHSFGGGLVPLVASRSRDVAFVITLAGYAVSGRVLMMEARRLAEESEGGEGAGSTRALELQASILDAAQSGGPWDSIERQHRELRRTEYERLPEEARSRYENFDAYVSTTFDQAVLDLAKTPWFASFLAFDPSPAIRSLNVPFLALFGRADASVPPELNVAPMRTALASNPHATVHVVPEADHFFRVSGEFSETMLSTLAEWFLEQVVDQ